MKTHTSDFKNNVKLFGRELDSIISYTLENEDIELGNEDLNSITPHYESAILKSAMKQLDVDSNIEIPEGTILNYRFGVKVRNEEVENYRNNYDYVNFGNYVVYKSEKQEDTNSYKITCYDKMLYSMIEYNNETKLNITYPISIRDYINAICNKLGLVFKNVNNTFANYNKQIQNELYLDASDNSLGYTYRDILDELAQVTASTICIDEATDSLEVRYINNTGDTINGDYLKNINVNFGEKYGPVNSIVLSRSAGADNVYLKDEQSVTQNGLCEIKITDNQIMNFNDRADYLPDILYRLDGLEYYLNDFASTGITYYNLCDKYNVEIDDTTYSCIMFNDEVNITQGLEEKVYTEMPESAETDYTKADKTDRRINQTYLIVDKQNQIIESVVSNVTEQNNKISQITQTVDEINSKISDIADITTSAEDTDAQVELEEINESEPIQLKVHPVSVNISYLYPNSALYPSSNLFLKRRTIRFIRTYVEEGVTKTQNIDYELPEDLLYYDQDTYDEFYLDYDSQTCQVTKKCKWNADGTVGLLSSTQTTSYPYPTILLGSGNYTVSILGYSYGYISVRLMAQNIYTTQFYTKAETNTLIDQTAKDINIGVDTKLTNYATTTQLNSAISLTNQSISAEVSRATNAENVIRGSVELKVDKNDNDQIVSMINASADTITLDSNRLIINSTNFKLNSSGNITATGGTIGGWTINTNSLHTADNNYYLGVTGITATIGETSIDNIIFKAGSKFGVSSGGTLYAQNAILNGATVSGTIYATAGNISGDLLTSGTIRATNISLKGVYLSPSNSTIGGFNVTSSSLSNNNFSVTTDGQLNLYPQVGGGGTYRINNGLRLNASSGVLISSNGGQPNFPSADINIMGLNGASVYLACRWGNSGSERSAITCADGTLYLNSVGAIYANGVQIGGSSSKATKENIIDLKQEDKDELYDLIKNIPLKHYDYKKQYGKKTNYGFIIEDIENTKLNTLLHIVQNKENKDIKNYSSEDLTRLELVVIQEMMKKIEKLEEKYE